jgi:hypothetical protein
MISSSLQNEPELCNYPGRISKPGLSPARSASCRIYETGALFIQTQICAVGCGFPLEFFVRLDVKATIFMPELTAFYSMRSRFLAVFVVRLAFVALTGLPHAG